ncbi:hypothetical protein HDU96_009556 [Phlyctochytrium bullatum]|nr:hypothetical protein HDU96_009556 [Phlyctochytrium bullatum]
MPSTETAPPSVENHSAAADPASTVHLANVAYFSGNAFDLVPSGTVSFDARTGRITSLSATGVSGQALEAAIDCSGYLLLPGLIDVGIVLSHDLSKLPPVTLEAASEDLESAFKAGTTTAVVATKDTDHTHPSSSHKLPNIIRFTTSETGHSASFTPADDSSPLKATGIRLKPPLKVGSATGALAFSCYPSGLEGSGILGLSVPPTPWRTAEGLARVLVASGLTFKETLVSALQAVTSGAADALGLEGKGRIAEGAIADLILLKLDSKWAQTTEGILLPLLLSGALNISRVHAVFLNGIPKHVVTATSLTSQLATLTLGSYYLGPNLPAVNGSSDSGFNTIPEALEAIKRGEFIIAVDNEDRENEGDFIIAGEHATDEKMAFMIRYSSGLICVPMPGDRLDALELPLMVEKNQDTYRTAYTISVDLAQGTSTGISSGDRARTIAALADPNAKPSDFNRPGHVFPLRAKEGGVLRRVGHTEASVDLCRLAGCQPVAAICEVVLDEGGMARRDELRVMAKKWGLKMITIADLVKYRVENGYGEDW